MSISATQAGSAKIQDSPSPSACNADGSSDGVIGTIYVSMDAGNVWKNFLGAGACAATLAGSSKIAAMATLPITGLNFLIGLFYVGTGIVGINESLNTATSATNARKNIKNKMNLTQDKKVNQVALCRIKEFIAWVGVANWSLYIGIGLAQLGSAIVILLGQQTAQTLHTTAILTGQVSKTALLGLLTALGVAYIIRGCVTLYRSYYGMQHAISLRNSLETIISNLNQTLPFIEQKNKIINFLEENCALNNSETSDIYTDNYNFSDITDLKQFKQYIQALDEGIHDEICKQKIARIIGASMILGGALTLVAANLSGGTSILLTSLISSIIFIMMEGTFLLYDSIPHFQSYAHKHYQQPDYLKDKGTQIYRLKSKQFKEYQTELYWVTSNSPLFNASVPTPNSAVLMKPKLNWSELAWSPLYPLIRYEKYKTHQTDTGHSSHSANSLTSLETNAGRHSQAQPPPQAQPLPQAQTLSQAEESATLKTQKLLNVAFLLCAAALTLYLSTYFKS